ncbi:aminopeptidase P family protein [Bariatricus massiliensis]|uniref:Xaa-Pro aminopeptidase n=1 Tax=Bariatricus massiliensis TaxID=1745713 RepID=A0ABS8DBM4_9FIRM|nr:aminopeptidase P family protein [Bariatricus massiliensis]MCB7303735.1 aminopeptidase P family protein [Bariatricus massiliensis]MCB7373151.1 aminopeptidase P family protein [Bariatricus massiliensis]MCB7385821.1 aminopeptidase P family protein [Bariatricus massiliensis]MCB7409983.1 aminopeptidase P family protein [Bariatricus massiliensis]MCQ5253049.1 aminopeptidase P family protein [Bariatricus massiliensis]
MISKEFHASRRMRYAELLQDNSMGFVFSGKEKSDKGDQVYPFTPYANFYYLTGFTQHEAILMITKMGGKVSETLFIDHPDERSKRWLGIFYTAESVQEETGIENVQYLEKFEGSIPLFKGPDRIEHVYVDLASWGVPFYQSPAQEFAARIQKSYPAIHMHNTFHNLALMRQVKSAEEIALHRRACEITEEGVKNMLRHIKPDMYEYEAEAYFDFSLKMNNAKHAFDTIAASEINACSMHYSANDRKMADGDMILFDLGAEWKYYASDVSRTYPVNGHFTEQQKALYNVVLKGLDAAIEATKPGQPKNELELLSKKVMAEELMKLGMIEKPEDIMKYYFHGSGHYIGLYTHDVGDDNAVLEEDMVFTLEPGLYFDDLKIGIRIEDTLVVTKDGCEVLSGNIPKTVEDIEAFMQMN